MAKMNRSVLYGLIAGLVTAGINLLIYFVDQEASTLILILQFLPLTIAIIFIFLSVNYAKKQTEDLSFRGALRAGVITTLSLALITTAGKFIITSTTSHEEIRANAYTIVEIEKAKHTVPKDSIERDSLFQKLIVSGDSALDKQIYPLASAKFIHALALKKDDAYAKSKMEFLVGEHVKDATDIGKLIQASLFNIVFFIIIGGIISGISYFLLKQR